MQMQAEWTAALLLALCPGHLDVNTPADTRTAGRGLVGIVGEQAKHDVCLSCACLVQVLQ